MKIICYVLCVPMDLIMSDTLIYINSYICESESVGLASNIDNIYVYLYMII